MPPEMGTCGVSFRKTPRVSTIISEVAAGFKQVWGPARVHVCPLSGLEALEISQLTILFGLDPLGLAPSVNQFFASSTESVGHPQTRPPRASSWGSQQNLHNGPVTRAAD